MKFTTKKLSPELHLLLATSRVVKIDDNTYELIINRTLSKTYTEFKKILKCLRGHWNKKTHIFNYDPSDNIHLILENGCYPEINPNAFFPTPLKVVEDMAHVVDFFYSGINHKQILEPSAGDGNICKGLMEYEPNLEKHHFDCFDIDPLNREILKAQGFNVVGDNFLTHHNNIKYRWVFMNPPFSVDGDKNSYITHINKAIELMQDGGKLSAIVPISFLSSDNKEVAKLRNYVALTGGWEPCSNGAFKESGTMVKCCHVWFTKLNINSIDHYRNTSLDDLVDIVLPAEIDWHNFSNDIKYKLNNESITIDDAKNKVFDFMDKKIKYFTNINTPFCWDDETKVKFINNFLSQSID